MREGQEEKREQNTLLGHSAAARLETGLAPRHGAIAAVGRRRHAPVALRRSLRCSAASVDCSAVPRGCQCHYGRSDVPPRPTLPKRMSWIVKVLVDDGVVMFWCVVLFVEYHSIVTWLWIHFFLNHLPASFCKLVFTWMEKFLTPKPRKTDLLLMILLRLPVWNGSSYKIHVEDEVCKID